MGYEDWPEPMQEVYDNATAFSWLSESNDPLDHATAESLFEVGWVYDAGYNNSDIREYFYEFSDVDERDIDWDAWREFWGYD